MTNTIKDIIDNQEGEDGLYYKYRVFREPDDVDTHPIPMTAYYRRHGDRHFEWPNEDPVGYAKEVTDFIFPLKPDTDHHARVALAAYAVSVSEEKPHLARDLFDVLRDMMEEVEKGIL